jgi:hypothetical protein
MDRNLYGFYRDSTCVGGAIFETSSFVRQEKAYAREAQNVNRNRRIEMVRFVATN